MPPRSAAMVSLAGRVMWKSGGHCYLRSIYLGRIFRAEVGWLVIPAGESAVVVASEEEARARLLELMEARAARFLDAVRGAA